MARYDIVIPHWGEGMLTDICRLCLDSVADAGGDFRLILVDNGSADPGRLQKQLDRMDHVVIRNSENLGFIRATNQGMHFSTAPLVVLLNNDTLVPPGWLKALEQPFFCVPDAGLSGPLTDTTASWQGQWRVRNNGGIVTLAPNRMLAFFCVMIRRAVIDEIGYLDESYGVGFGDDDEYCRRAEEAGFKLCLCQDVKVSHRHRTSFQVRYTPEEITRMQADAMRRFRLSKGVYDGPARRKYEICAAAVCLGKQPIGTPLEQIVALAQLLYESYRSHTGGISLATGRSIPEWKDVQTDIQEAWMASASAGLAYASARVSTALEGLFSHGM